MSAGASTRIEQEPGRWVIALDGEWTPDQMCELGRALGERGFTGQFLSGSVGDALCRYSKWMKDKREAGGD